MTKAAAGKERSRPRNPVRRSLKSASGSTGTKDITSAVSLEGNQEEYIVYVAVPGMERKDFSVTIINKKLVVSAVKKEALHCFSDLEEQSFPEWKEIFILPADADTVMTAAVYKNGELQIHIPKGKDATGVEPVEVFIY